MSEDFGLLYASTFTGSMFGTSPTIHAVWGYVVANGYGGTVDLTPKVLAATLGTTLADVEAAIQFHCAPDPESRSDVDEGRRLRHLGGVTYEIVNHELYRNARALEEKRAYNRQKKRASRERARAVEIPIFDLSKNSVTTVDPLDLDSSSSSVSRSGSPEGVQGEGAPTNSTPSNSADTTRAAMGVAAPPPDDATPAVQESRPLGLPAAAAAPPELHTKLGDWLIPPELYDEAERDHGLSRPTLEFRVRKLRNRKIPGDGVWDRTEYVRGLLPDWATWGEPKPSRASARPPPARSSPPWLDHGSDAPAAALNPYAWAPTAEHRDVCKTKGLDVRFATNAYRASGRPERLSSTLRANEDFMERLKYWADTGEFVPDGPLRRERARGAA